VLRGASSVHGGVTTGALDVSVESSSIGVSKMNGGKRQMNCSSERRRLERECKNRSFDNKNLFECGSALYYIERSGT
jgi:hypothetical protein